MNAATAFTTAAATIADQLVADGATPEQASAAAVDYLMQQMMTEQPEMAAKVFRGFVALNA